MPTPEWLQKVLQDDDRENLLHLYPEDKAGKTSDSVTYRVSFKSYDAESLERLVGKFGPDCLTSRDLDDDTPVHHVARCSEDVAALEFLHETLGSDCFGLTGLLGRTPIHCAAENNYSNSALKYLVKVCGPDSLTVKDRDGNMPIHLVAEYQGCDSLELIKDKLGESSFSLHGYYERTAVHLAAMNRVSSDALGWLINELGAKCLTEQDEDNATPVHLAAEFQDSDVMRLLKKELGSACFYWKGKHKKTVFHYAATNVISNDALKWLVGECGAKCLTLRDEHGDTPVHYAAWVQAADSLQFVADQLGTKVFWVKGSNEETVTHSAAQNTRSNFALAWCVTNLGPNCLLDKGSAGRTPAHLAAQYQGVDSLRLIADSLGFSAFELLKDAKGKTVADYAAMNSEGDRMLEWIAEQRKQLQSVPAQQREQEEQKLQWMMMELQLEPQSPVMSSSDEPQPLEQSVEAAPAMSPKRTESAQNLSSACVMPPALDASFGTWNFILNGKGKKQIIGAGGFGQVYKVFTDKHQTLAVKIVTLMQESQDAEALEQAIQSEENGINILRNIRHPNIVLFLKCETTSDGEFCIFTELISGHSLYDLMSMQRKPFDEAGVRKFSKQICSALNFLHCNQQKPILHRDIKCSNIMLTHEGVIKLIDFGLAKEIVTTIGNGSNNLCGTWYFMAPELFDEDGRVVYTPVTDVWAFGCTVFEMMKMQPPNRELAVQQIPLRISKRDLPDLPAEASASLQDFYRRCVAREPGERADTTELMGHEFLINE